MTWGPNFQFWQPKGLPENFLKAKALKQHKRYVTTMTIYVSQYIVLYFIIFQPVKLNKKKKKEIKSKWIKKSNSSGMIRDASLLQAMPLSMFFPGYPWPLFFIHIQYTQTESIRLRHFTIQLDSQGIDLHYWKSRSLK